MSNYTTAPGNGTSSWDDSFDRTTDPVVWRILGPVLVVYTLAAFIFPVYIPASRSKVVPAAKPPTRYVPILRVNLLDWRSEHLDAHRATFMGWESVVPYSVVSKKLADIRAAWDHSPPLVSKKAAIWATSLTALLVLVPYLAFDFAWATYYYMAIFGVVGWNVILVGIALAYGSLARIANITAAIHACNDPDWPALVWSWERDSGRRRQFLDTWLVVWGDPIIRHPQSFDLFTRNNGVLSDIKMSRGV